MRPLPGQLPPILTTGRLLSVAYFVGLVSCLGSWALLVTSNAPSLRLSGLNPIEDVAGMVVGVIACLAISLGTSILVGRARGQGAAISAAVLGAAMAFAACSSATAVHLFAHTEATGMYDRFVVRNGFTQLEFKSQLGPEVIGNVLVYGGIAALVGALVGLALARPASWAAGRGTASLDASSGRLLVGIGVWLAVPVAIAWAFAAFAALFDPSRSGLLWLSLILPLMSGVATLAGFRLNLRRERWIAAVKRGEVPNYRVREPAPLEAAGLPSLGEGTDADAPVLEEIVRLGDGDPYRGRAEIAAPIARLRR